MKSVYNNWEYHVLTLCHVIIKIVRIIINCVLNVQRLSAISVE